MNAFEPNLNLVVNTNKVKQTFNVGMRFMTMDMFIRSDQSTCEKQILSMGCATCLLMSFLKRLTIIKKCLTTIQRYG